VYHLSARTVYGAIHETGKRGRRRRPVVSIKPRLMALDFVLARPDVRFLSTEEERMAQCDALGIDRARLPQQRYLATRSGVITTRYFLEHAPIGVVADASDALSILFTYIDDGAVSIAGFESYLRRYARVFAALPGWQVVYVADTSRHMARAQAAFRRVYGHELAARPAADPTLVDTVLEYFRLSEIYAAKRWPELNKSRLDRLRELRQRFCVGQLEGLYAEWEVRGDEAVRAVFGRSGDDSACCRGTFKSWILPHSYAAVDPVRAVR
jgi:hypothetical protein